MFANCLTNNYINSLYNVYVYSLNLTVSRPLWKSSKDVRANVFNLLCIYSVYQNNSNPNLACNNAEYI